MTAADPLHRLPIAFAAHKAGKVEEAATIYEAVLAVAPDNPDALNLLASLRRGQGAFETAAALARRAATAAPERPDILYNLGNALSSSGDLPGAIAAFRRVLDRDMSNPDAACNLGIALAQTGDFAGAVEAYQQALAISPDHQTASNNLGNALVETGRFEEAVSQLRTVCARWPDLAEARYNLSLGLLRLGDFHQGFAGYEWRWRAPSFVSPVRHARTPDWNGRPFPGKRLLVHAEQGIGDTIQFVRLLPLAASLGGSITLEVPANLVRLFKNIEGAERVVATENLGKPHDLQSALLGLPYRLGLSLGALPPRIPYLFAEADRVAFWKKRLAEGRGDRRPLVAVCWRGNPASPVDRGRSLRGPAALAPLAGVPGLRLICVGKLSADEIEPSKTPTGWKVGGIPFVIEHPGPEFDGGADAFIDTAGVLAHAAHVVTTDTSIAHLAGAMGRPCTVLLKAVPDWRWLVERTDTPWYPTMKLARQPVAGDFTRPLAEAVRHLESVARSQR